MGGEHNHVINNALIGPPLSPSKKNTPKFTKSSSDQYFHPQPPTPDAVLGKKRPASVSPSDASQHDRPPTQKPRIDNSEEGSSSGVPMEDLIGKVEDVVKMLKRVSGNKDNLVSDPLLTCFVSAQALLMACTAELMSRSTRKAKPLVHQHSDGSVNYSSTTTADAAGAGGSGEKKKVKKYKSSSK